MPRINRRGVGTKRFRLVRDLTTKAANAWALGTYDAKDPRSDEAEGLDWNGMARQGTYWGDILLQAKKDNLVLVPNVDACTAWCAVKSGLRVVSMKARYTKTLGPDGQPVAMPVSVDKLVPALGLWAFHTTIDFAKRYMMPYFDMLEKKELPDMSLLEWLVTMGGVAPSVARAAITRYSRARKDDPVLLHETDLGRLGAAADARQDALRTEEAEAAESNGGSAG